jgi:hypothetical protein
MALKMSSEVMEDSTVRVLLLMVPPLGGTWFALFVEIINAATLATYNRRVLNTCTKFRIYKLLAKKVTDRLQPPSWWREVFIMSREKGQLHLFGKFSSFALRQNYAGSTAAYPLRDTQKEAHSSFDSTVQITDASITCVCFVCFSVCLFGVAFFP